MAKGTKKYWLKSLIVSLILCALGIVAALGPVRLIGMLPELLGEELGLEPQVAAIMMQFKKATVAFNWWLLIPGTLLIWMPVHRMCKTKHFIVGFLCFFPLIIFQLLVTLASVATMYVNKVPIATLLEILIKWAMNGGI